MHLLQSQGLATMRRLHIVRAAEMINVTLRPTLRTDSRVRTATAASSTPARPTAVATSISKCRRLLHWLPNMVAVITAGRISAPVQSHRDSRRTQLARLSDMA